MLRVLGFARLGGNAGISAPRLIWPLEELNKRSDFECKWVDQDTFRKLVASGNETEMVGYDLYVMARLHAPIQSREQDFFFAGEKGKVLYEVDDDLTCHHRDFGYGDYVEATARAADAVTVSTRGLGDVMSQFNRHVHVLPNHVKTSFYIEQSMKAKRRKDNIVVGMVGTRTHFADWLQVIEPLKRLKAKYGDKVTVACGGYCPPYMDAIDDVLHFENVPFSLYPRLVRQFDIRLCPLEPIEDDPFNISKSPISALEAMAAARPVGHKVGGAVAVVSDHPVFRGTVNAGNGVLVKAGEWYDVLDELIGDRPTRDKLSVKGHKWVCKNRDVAQTAPLWARAYKEVCSAI